jgi:acyl homoserine lactone synthase
MYRDRKRTFKEELGWKLKTDSNGRELDEYDFLNPQYIILANLSGDHIASSRLLPTTGRTMIAEKFSNLTHGVEIESSTIWEVSRFFVSRKSNSRVRDAARLMFAGCEAGVRAGLTHFVGITNTSNVPIFRACGWPGEVVNTAMTSEGEICSCLWEVSPEMLERLRKKARLEEVDYYVSPRVLEFAGRSEASIAA